ncbi:hypothetical protein DCAR_0314109 [Daucus carota subsp. sativus]|uniref:F-box domain-containing protein n=1 Tax=Daucus carota subsp. sativus TaxID=79200 RepID=A0AAF0WS93_DAUCS|nr:PREDICTED: EID1-like F-box protein 3 [Daucus carota subsp. sativus]WOG94812.1 hypothetical protein DCAR_0314109 [Daucus carota subsp. sativus]
MSSSSSQRRRVNSDSLSCVPESGILNERILLLVFESLKWDVNVLCQTACVSRKLQAVAKRLLWKELCLYRAPRMVSELTSGGPASRLGGGFSALAKLLFYCCGCESTRCFEVSQPVPGHFMKSTRFSKTSGRSFLMRRCGSDLLYVSDPCEHPTGSSNRGDDLGIFRGVFRGFLKSKTRDCLIRGVGLEDGVHCPYCGARCWSMTAARLVPKSAARRLGANEDGIEYFVCVNGHMYGTCWLVRLSSDDGDDDHDDDDKNFDQTVNNSCSN